jgi:hypothetical protein
MNQATHSSPNLVAEHPSQCSLLVVSIYPVINIVVHSGITSPIIPHPSYTTSGAVDSRRSVFF